MVAIATLPRTVASPTTTAPGRVRRPSPAGPGRAGRPALALVPPHARGAARRGRPAGRLVAAAALALAVLLAGAYLVRTPTVAPSAPATHVVAEGETLWSIAVATAPAGEAAGYVERLVEANGTARVAPGQTVTLPRP